MTNHTFPHRRSPFPLSRETKKKIKNRKIWKENNSVHWSPFAHTLIAVLLRRSDGSTRARTSESGLLLDFSFPRHTANFLPTCDLESGARQGTTSRHNNTETLVLTLLFSFPPFSLLFLFIRQLRWGGRAQQKMEIGCRAFLSVLGNVSYFFATQNTRAFGGLWTDGHFFSSLHLFLPFSLKDEPERCMLSQ